MHFLYLLVIYAIAEFIWLYTMQNYYAQWLSAFGKLKIQNLIAAILSYVFLIFGFYILVIRQPSVINGAMYGLAVYGIYNMTNLAILKDYKWSMAIIDTIWGVCIMSSLAYIYIHF